MVWLICFFRSWGRQYPLFMLKVTDLMHGEVIVVGNCSAQSYTGRSPKLNALWPSRERAAPRGEN